MESIKIGEILGWLSKSKIKANEGGDYGKFPFFTSSQIQSKWYDKSLYNNECLIFGTGGNANIHYYNGRFSTSTDCLVATLKVNRDINIKYIFYYLKANFYLLEKGFQGVAIKHISKSYLSNITIQLPSFEEQNRIVTVLDKVDTLIKKREQVINSTDKLLAAQYDVLFSPKNKDYNIWGEISLEEYKMGNRGMRTGPFGSSLTHDKFQDEGDVAVLGIDNAVDNTFRWKKKRYISLEDYNSLQNFRVYEHDVLITIMGTVGRSAVVPKDIGLAINTKHLAAITVNKEKCNPYYLSYSIFSSPYIKEQLKARSRGAIMDGLNLTILKQLKIKDVPIELQNEFAEKYKRTEVLKNKLLDSLVLYNNLLNSLFKEYLSPRKGVDIDIEVEAVLNEIDKDVTKFDVIKNDIALRQSLLDKLASHDFDSIEKYNKAKVIIFNLLKEYPDRIRQEFDNVRNMIKLTT